MDKILCSLAVIFLFASCNKTKTPEIVFDKEVDEQLKAFEKEYFNSEINDPVDILSNTLLYFNRSLSLIKEQNWTENTIQPFFEKDEFYIENTSALSQINKSSAEISQFRKDYLNQMYSALTNPKLDAEQEGHVPVKYRTELLKLLKPIADKLWEQNSYEDIFTLYYITTNIDYNRDRNPKLNLKSDFRLLALVLYYTHIKKEQTIIEFNNKISQK